jgi:two-component system cell cycle response regulator DivK
MLRVRSAAARRRAPPGTEEPTGTRRRVLPEGDSAPLVLIVDDAEDARDIYSEFFAHSGWRVALAVDGEHALLKIVSVMPALVIMDLSMPVLDGWDATRQIRSHPKTKHIPVIALTGHVSEEHLQRARDAGADAVLTKP